MRAGPGPGLHNCCGPGPGLGLKSYLRAGPGPRFQARAGHYKLWLKVEKYFNGILSHLYVKNVFASSINMKSKCNMVIILLLQVVLPELVVVEIVGLYVYLLRKIYYALDLFG